MKIKNKDYKPSPEQVKHVKELMELFEAMGDHRFMEAYNEYVMTTKEEPKMITDALDKLIAKGEARGENKLAELIRMLLHDGKDDEVRVVVNDEKHRQELYVQYGIA